MSPMLLKTLFLGNQAALFDIYFSSSRMNINGSLTCECKNLEPILFYRTQDLAFGAPNYFNDS